MLTCAFTALWVPDQTFGAVGWDPEWYPNGTADVFATPSTYSDLEVSIPLNDMREAKLTMSTGDPAIDWFYALWTPQIMLKAWYYDDVVFWGPCMRVEYAEDGLSATIYAAGPEVRMKAHYVRLGDRALNSSTHATLPNSFNRHVPVDHVGLRWLRDAANVDLDDEGDPWYPPLGIADGYNDVIARAANTRLKMKFARGDEVFASMLALAGTVGGPDFEIAPVQNRPDIPDDGIYAKLNTYKWQGWKDGYTGRQYTPTAPGSFDDDQPFTRVAYHDGMGADNASIGFTAGAAPPVTHAHVLSEDAKVRRTVAGFTGAGAMGVWVRWRATSYNGKNVADVLDAEGERIIDAYQIPLEAWTVTPRLENPYRYLRDFMVGSKIMLYKRLRARGGDLGAGGGEILGHLASYHAGVDVTAAGGVRITRVILNGDSAGNTQELLEVIMDTAGYHGPSASGDE